MGIDIMRYSTFLEAWREQFPLLSVHKKIRPKKKEFNERLVNIIFTRGKRCKTGGDLTDSNRSY